MYRHLLDVPSARRRMGSYKQQAMGRAIYHDSAAHLPVGSTSCTLSVLPPVDLGDGASLFFCTATQSLHDWLSILGITMWCAGVAPVEPSSRICTVVLK